MRASVDAIAIRMQASLELAVANLEDMKAFARRIEDQRDEFRVALETIEAKYAAAQKVIERLAPCGNGLSAEELILAEMHTSGETNDS